MDLRELVEHLGGQFLFIRCRQTGENVFFQRFFRVSLLFPLRHVWYNYRCEL